MNDDHERNMRALKEGWPMTDSFKRQILAQEESNKRVDHLKANFKPFRCQGGRNHLYSEITIKCEMDESGTYKEWAKIDASCPDCEHTANAPHLYSIKENKRKLDPNFCPEYIWNNLFYDLTVDENGNKESYRVLNENPTYLTNLKDSAAEARERGRKAYEEWLEKEFGNPDDLEPDQTVA